jgi:hypothetical protein
VLLALVKRNAPEPFVLIAVVAHPGIGVAAVFELAVRHAKFEPVGAVGLMYPVTELPVKASVTKTVCAAPAAEAAVTDVRVSAATPAAAATTNASRFSVGLDVRRAEGKL